MSRTEDFSSIAIALEQAYSVFGRTAPNPPVGACIVDNQGRLLAAAAHHGAGQAHAEAAAIKAAKERFGPETLKTATLYVTLEPCNHTGRTPPCVQAILSAGLRRVVYCSRDINPNVEGGGTEALKKAAVHVDQLFSDAAERLIRPFSHWAHTSKPWIVHKMAFRRDPAGLQTMIPEGGQKTFSRAESLKLAHELRRQSEAIITTLETIQKDLPSFTVRNTWDHADLPFRRKIAILSRKTNAESLLPVTWLDTARKAGFEVSLYKSFEDAVVALGRANVHQALVEAGPTLSRYVIEKGLWNENVTISVGEERDFVVRSLAEKS